MAGSGFVAVIGEAVADAFPVPANGALGLDLRVLPGGSPANTAVTLARLETPVAFAGRSSGDAFGRLTRDHLAENGVDLRYVIAAAEPASLAVVSVRDDGSAAYSFHVAGTSDWAWSADELPAVLPDDVDAVHTGSLGLAMPPGGRVLEAWLEAQHGRHTISVDPNVRPALVGPRDEYRNRLESWVRFSGIVKVSVEDLAWVYPGENAADVVRRWVATGGPVFVAVTLGRDGALGYIGDDEIRQPAAPADVADTVGAGDSFMAALVAGLARNGRLNPVGLAQLTAPELNQALEFASAVAAITCSRPGADPPYRHELSAAAGIG
jgi:fructokinase